MIVDFLPGSYAKMISWKDIQAKVLRINFLQKKDGVLKKMTHGVKKVKGEYIKNLCQYDGMDISHVEFVDGEGSIEVFSE